MRLLITLRGVLTEDMEDGYLREDLHWNDVHPNNRNLIHMIINLMKSNDNWSKKKTLIGWKNSPKDKRPANENAQVSLSESATSSNHSFSPCANANSCTSDNATLTATNNVNNATKVNVQTVMTTVA